MSATAASTERRIYRFDDLEVDPVRRVLLRDGEAVPITPKAFSILVVLLERRGNVMSKEDLIRAVWSSAYVSEANLTQTISSLRKALGDRLDERRYVVTIPGQGYCFAPPVQEIVDDRPSGEHPVQPQQSAPSEQPEVTAERPAAARASLWIVLALLAVVAAAVILPQLAHGPLALPEDLASAIPAPRPSVAVLGFKDLSGRPDTLWLGSALSEMLTTELAAGTRVRVVSRDNVARVRKSLEIPGSGPLAGEDLERFRSIVGSDLLVLGTYLVLDEKDGRRIRLDVRVQSASDGDVVTSLAEVGTEKELFELVSRTGGRLRQLLGFEGLSPAQARAARALQPSGQASLRPYAEGLERLHASDAPRAMALLQSAVGAEPRSPVIHSALSQAYSQMGYDKKAVAEAEKAVELAASLPHEQRLGIEARLYELSRQWSRAGETYRSLWTFFPDDLEYGYHLAYCLMMGGDNAEAGEVIIALRHLPPPQSDNPRIDILEARLTRRLADPAGQLRAAEAAVAKGERSGESLLLAQALVFQGDALSTLGKPGDAIPLFRRARDLASQEGNPMLVGMALANLGVALQKSGRLDEAEDTDREALAIAQRIGAAVGIAAQLQILGTLHYLRGEPAEALRLLEESRSWYVRIGDRSLEAWTLDTIGLVRWAQGDLPGARQAFEQARAISHDTGDRANEAAAGSHLGRILARQGRLSEASRLHQQALDTFRTLKDPAGIAASATELADTLARRGDLAGARKLDEEALRNRRSLGDTLGLAEALNGLAEIHRRQGDLGTARRLAAWEARVARDTGTPLARLRALRTAGRLEAAAGRPVEARRAFEDALALGVQAGQILESQDLRVILAALALADGRSADAAHAAREAALWYRARDLAGDEARAMAVLAAALQRQGQPVEAERAAERARVRAEASQDRGVIAEVERLLQRSTPSSRSSG